MLTRRAPPSVSMTAPVVPALVAASTTTSAMSSAVAIRRAGGSAAAWAKYVRFAASGMPLHQRAFLDDTYRLAGRQGTVDVLSALMAEARIDTEFGERFRTAFLARRRDALHVVPDRAAERGDLPDRPGVTTVLDIVFGTLRYRVLATREADSAETLVDARRGPHRHPDTGARHRRRRSGHGTVTGQRPAVRAAEVRTSRSISGVSTPVKVLRWLTW
jgi:hypothetical protein